MKHSSTCNMAFGRKDPSCPRCQELLAGAAPKASWHKRYYAMQRANAAIDKASIASIAAHFAPGGPHATGKCGPVCTFGDY